MLRHRVSALALLLMVPFAAACSDDPEEVETGGSGMGVANSPETSAASTTAGIDAAALTESWGCGYAFNQSDVDQTVAVQLWYQGDDMSVDPLAAETAPFEITLPDDSWSATFVTGTDLYANFCDDVIEENEPTPDIDEEWELSAGTLTITAAGSTPCGGTPVHAELTDATFVGPDGEETTIDSLALTNEGWGCFAG